MMEIDKILICIFVTGYFAVFWMDCFWNFDISAVDNRIGQQNTKIEDADDVFKTTRCYFDTAFLSILVLLVDYFNTACSNTACTLCSQEKLK